ncbi:MAG: UPF0182 family protein [Actinomycetota bacterium]
MSTPRRGVTRGRVALVVVLIALFLFVTSIRGVAGFYTDFLWFDSLGLSAVWRTVLGTRVLLVVAFTLIFFVLMWINLAIADRLAPTTRAPGPEEELIERYQDFVGGRRMLVRSGVSLLLGLIAGTGVSGQWENVLFFFNRQEFGIEDPQFGRDVGFYVFQLPFIGFLVSWSFAAVLIVTIVTAVAHYLNGGIRLQPEEGDRVTPQVKAHISLLLGILALIKAVGYWFDRFELTLSQRGFVDGATFTDIEAQLPALNLLVLISLFAFGLLVFNIWRRGFTWPILAVGLWALVAVVAGGIYPAFIQRFRVEPAESSREAPFIDRNIEATRAAMGLDDVQIERFDYEPVLSPAEVEASRETVDNVRLLDPGVVRDSFQRLEGVRSFYDFQDLDVSRYEIDGETVPVVLSARELDVGGLPTRTWEATTIRNTHGYGLAVAPSNEVEPSGQPDFIVSGVPIDSETAALDIDQPRIYFGEGLGGYAIVGAETDEVDFQTEDDVVQEFRYDGEAGVGIGSFLRRSAFALRFGDLNPLISSEMQGDSRILLNRDVVDRVETVAPFLRLDADPYPAVIDGDVVFILDGYTITDRYPYAQEADRDQLTPGTGLNSDFNYIRNSVKVVVDAYDGSVVLYVVDPDDPLIQAYQDIFPDLFAEGPPSAELEAQFRYPEDLFRVQTNMWGRYRIDVASEFYVQTGAWDVAQDPGNQLGQRSVVTEVDEETGLARDVDARIAPQYLQMTLPGRESAEFVLFRPFSPFSEAGNRPQLTGFMTAGSDPGSYGELIVYEIAGSAAPDNPAQFASESATTPEISRVFSLLEGDGSEIVAGNLLLVPVENSLLYVRPIYLQAQGATPLPQLEQVIVGFEDRVVMRDTFEQALTAAVSGQAVVDETDLPDDDGADVAEPEPDEADPEPDEADPEPGPPTTEAPDTTTAPVEGTVEELLQQAAAAFAEADEALRAGDLATYQELVDQAQELVDQALDQSGNDPPPTTTTTTTEPVGTDA